MNTKTQIDTYAAFRMKLEAKGLAIVPIYHLCTRNGHHEGDRSIWNFVQIGTGLFVTEVKEERGNRFFQIFGHDRSSKIDSSVEFVEGNQ